VSHMAFVDLQCPNPSSIIDGSVLEATNLLAFIVLEGKKGHVNLYVVARNPLCIALGVDMACPPNIGPVFRIVFV
jgi:hypothetical protein